MLKEGDVVDIRGTHTVYADVPKHFLYSNCLGDFSLDRSDVLVSDVPWLAGRYVVTKTATDGGGTGHGPGDIYPDGHHVFCESVDGKFKLDFYQSGSFTAMIREIEPIGRAKIKWEVGGFTC